VHAWSIKWEIGNRFRAFDFVAKNNRIDPRDLTTRSTQLFDQYAPRIDEGFDAWLARRANETAETNGRGISPYGKANTGPWIEGHPSKKPHYDPQFVQLPEKIYLRVKLEETTKHDTFPDGSCDIFLDASLIGHGPCRDGIDVPEVSSKGGLLSIKSSGKILHAEPFKPTHKVILGLGDSYAAGQGSPDQSTKWKHLSTANVWIPNTYLFRDSKETEIKKKWVKSGAEWYSPRCDRSFFSAQSLVALKMARQDPHIIVSFVHLACSGAEIIDGILAPQRLAPGMPDTPKNKRCTNLAKRNREPDRKVDSFCDVPQAQLTAAVETLCLGKVTTIDDAIVKRIRSYMHRIIAKNEQLEWIRREDLLTCEAPHLIKPDLVLIQVGGNDIGFSGIIAWGLVPFDSRYKLGNIVTNKARVDTHVTCPTPHTDGCVDDKVEPAASKRLVDLPYRYDALAYALEAVLDVKGDRVVLSGYPDPLYASSSEDSKLCSNPPNSNDDNEWQAMKIKVPSGVNPDVWQFNLTAKNQGLTTPWEADVLEFHVVQKLNATVKAAAQKCLSTQYSEECIARNWRYVDVSSVMEKAGWCTNSQGDNTSRLLKPEKLRSWNAYEDRVRKIRTTNDSAMTQWPGPESEKNNWISGTFHPNPWGYAAVADKIMKTIFPTTTQLVPLLP
jgi:lysophospholipase L1-like esterase